MDFEIEIRRDSVVEAQFDTQAEAKRFADWLDVSGRALFAEFVVEPVVGEPARCGQPGCPHSVAPGEVLCEGCLDLAKGW